MKLARGQTDVFDEGKGEAGFGEAGQSANVGGDANVDFFYAEACIRGAEADVGCEGDVEG